MGIVNKLWKGLFKTGQGSIVIGPKARVSRLYYPQARIGIVRNHDARKIYDLQRKVQREQL